MAVVNANLVTVRAQRLCHVDVISPGRFFFSTANQIKDSALRVENKPRTDLHYTETNKSEVRKRERQNLNVMVMELYTFPLITRY